MKSDKRMEIMVTAILVISVFAGIAPVMGHGSPCNIAYIYSTDTPSANSYKSLLDANSYSTTIIPMGDVVTTDFLRYGAIIIGSDTEDSWGDPASVSAINNPGKPIIGLGEGGYAFFGQLNLDTGSPHGWHGSEKSIYVVDSTHTIFNTPNAITIPPDKNITLYTTTSHVGIYLLSIPPNVVALGRETDHASHYPLTLENNRYLLWGFTASPADMTATSRDLFINVVSYMAVCPAAAVPALTPFGLIALVGLLAIVATSTILRKRKKR